jgi:hypothetical protein
MNTCEICGGTDLLVVHFSGLGEATFDYCRGCEAKRWVRSPDESIDLEEVMDEAAALPRSSRRRRRRSIA